MRPQQLEFSVASAAIKGAREYQEDSLRIWRPEGGHATNGSGPTLLAVLSDGMGGHVSGEIASKLVCDECVRHFSTDPGEPSIKLEKALLSSNQTLDAAIRENARLAGMGCTLVAVYLDESGLRWVSVGDSALLIFRKNRLVRANADHSLGALLDKQVAAKLISYDEAHNSPHRRSLRSALTGAAIPIAEVQKEPHVLVPGDWVIVASDGLETLSGNDIASIIAAHGDRNPVDLAEKLLKEVASRNAANQDNTSVIAIRVQKPDDTRTVRIAPRSEDQLTADAKAAALAQEATEPLLLGSVIGEVGGSPRTEPLRSSRRGGGGVVLAIALALVLAAGLLGYVLYVLSSGASQETDRGETKPQEQTTPAGGTQPAAEPGRQ